MVREKDSKKKNELETYNNVTNGGEFGIEMTMPYAVNVTIEGDSPIFLHGWNSDAVDEKAQAKTGSKVKKTDNLESYVYRTDNGEIGLPGTYIKGAIVGGAKYQQDPRSSRKSAQDLFKAGVVPLTEIASFGTKDWDYVDRRRVVIKMAAITRERPAFKTGWRLNYDLQVLVPEYITPQLLYRVLSDAGSLVGIADHRPTNGRFNIISFDVQEND